ncbi:MAG: c-type cytochrome domain-containing protein [Bacteroidota bacterium]
MKRLFISLLLFSVFLATVLLISCDDSITNNNIDKVKIPSQNVSYKEYIQPVFNYKCATAECHDDATRAGDYSMTTWTNVRKTNVVIPYSVETSILAWRIEGLGLGIMPPFDLRSVPLTENQIEGIKTWIKEGAENN